jgi:hypothetical protein
MGTQKTVRSARSVEGIVRLVTLFCRRNDPRLEASVEAQPRRILRRIDRLAKEAIPKKNDRKATFLHGNPSRVPPRWVRHPIIAWHRHRPSVVGVKKTWS